MRLGNLLILLALGPATAFAWGDDCAVRAERAGGVDVKGVEKVVIKAGAGDLKVVGRSNAVRIEARGFACAGNQKSVDAAQISVRREGNIVYVETLLPEEGLSAWWGKGDYAYIDLGVALPTNVPVEATDSSGDAEFEDLKSVQLQDSSGDLTLTRIGELADVNDSSGDLEIHGAGSAKLRDSSGDIVVYEIRGDVDVVQDSSGDIRIEKVGGNVHIEQDSSGDIHVEDVTGNFVVDSDSSGGIHAGSIKGDFTVSNDSSGDIDSENIGGKISIPENKRD